MILGFPYFFWNEYRHEFIPVGRGQAQELAPRQAQVPASKRKSWFSNARAGWKQEVPSFENESMPR